MLTSLCVLGLFCVALADPATYFVEKFDGGKQLLGVEEFLNTPTLLGKGEFFVCLRSYLCWLGLFCFGTVKNLWPFSLCR